MNKKIFELNIHLRRFVAYIVLVLVSAMCLIWVYTLFINATRSNSEMIGITLIPSKYFFYNLKNVLSSSLPVASSLINSLLVASICAIGCTYFAALCAYGFNVYDFPFKNAILTFLLMIMMVPTQVSTLGYIKLAHKMGLDDSLLSIILPRMAVPVTFYYIYQYMKVDVSKAYIEAARMDGAKELSIFHRIIFPMLKPALVVQFIFEFVNSWNSYFVPALMLHSDNKRTLPIVISLLRSVAFKDHDDGMIYMMIAIAILPVTLIYIVLSKQIVQGITNGGVKG